MSYSLLNGAVPFETDVNTNQYHEEMKGLAVAKRVARDLIEASVEFHVEPLPDDWWDFTVKREAMDTLLEITP